MPPSLSTPFFLFHLLHTWLISCLLFALLCSSLMKTTCPLVYPSECFMGQHQKPSLYCLPASCLLYHLLDSQAIFLGGHTGLSPFLLGASCIRAVFHPILSASFRSWEFSRAPFPIKIPFHKTAFTNSLDVLKSSGLSSLVHCFCSLLSWNSRALLICDLFHSEHLPQQQPLIQFSHINQQQTTSHQVELHTPHVTAAKSCSLSTKLQGWARHCNCLLNTYLGQSFQCCGTPTGVAGITFPRSLLHTGIWFKV